MLSGRAWTARAGRLTAALIMLTAAAFGVAFAAAFGPALIGAQTGGGQIYGCVNNYTGALRVVYSSSQCTGSERPISWNQQGEGAIIDIQYVEGTWNVETDDQQNLVDIKAECPAGYRIVGGGAGLNFAFGNDMWNIVGSEAALAGQGSFDNDGWGAIFRTSDGEAAEGTYQLSAEAICMLTT